MNRQRLILSILTVIFLIAAVWSYTSYPRQKTVDKLTYAPGQQAIPSPLPGSAPGHSAYDGRVLNMTLLEREKSDYKGYRRNIFKPVFVDEQKLLKEKAAAFKPPQLPQVQPQKVAPAEAVTAKPETVALARFTFLGFLKKDNRKTIFLANDKDILLVKIGDTIAGRYLASAITDQALTLQVTDSGSEIVIPLIENRPLGSAR